MKGASPEILKSTAKKPAAAKREKRSSIQKKSNAGSLDPQSKIQEKWKGKENLQTIAQGMGSSLL